MIVDINKIYVFSAPKASEGMTPEKDDVLTGSSDDIAYTKINKIHSASVDKTTVKWMGKVFEHKNMWMQAVIFYTDIPDRLAKKRINDKIEFIRSQGKVKK